MSFVIDDDDRYSRLRLISWWDQEKLRAAKILVVGAGALGNEVLKNLSLLGIGKVLVIDLDEIEESNLTRSVLFRSSDKGKSKAQAAAKMLHEINPDTQVIPIHGNVMTDIGLGVFRDVDVVIGCLDNREARLWVNRCCWKVGTPWVDGGIQEISGVAKVFVPPDSACYECAMTENDYRLISLRYSCPLLKREDLLAGKVPTAPTIASMIAGLQTQEALKLLHGLPVQAGAAMVFNGIANNFYTTHYQRREDCLSHETYPDEISLPLAASRNTLKELFAAAKGHFTQDVLLTLQLDRDLVVALHCNCGDTREIMQPQQLVSADEALCPKCGNTAQPEMIHAIDQTHPLVEKTLSSLGIPPYDMVRVTAGDKQHVFLLAADEAAVFSV
jgi:molybdopterin/thiamine biosynthesis adenylyltransferase